VTAVLLIVPLLGGVVGCPVYLLGVPGEVIPDTVRQISELLS
jgi:hypothetical protein